MAKYAIGMDFGTLSGRAVAVEIGTGRELASAVWPYTHAVMDETLWDGQKLPPDWALQYPRDYLEAMEKTIPQVIRESGIDAQDVIGIGIDFTACTVLPVKRDGTALCEVPEFKHNPHAYVKLWKHHAAQEHANRLNEIAAQRGEDFLPRYGGKISSEWLVPKVMQIVEEAPEVYDAADRIIEAADWVIWQLTGKETRNSCTAGYKAIWHKKKGYPGKDFFKALHPKLENLVEEKLSTDISPLGQKAGEVTLEASHWTGLNPGTAVAIANVDAHVCIPAVGIDGPGKLLAIMGTSTCHIMMGDKESEVPGMCGVVEDGVMPGFFGYEAGQSCVGDHFAWFVDHCCPEEYVKAAAAKGMDIHVYLTEKANALKVGESGLVALDWWNGNRSVLVDVDLTGLMVGMTLLTKPEEIYRALIEATAYGTRMIVENFQKSGVPVNELYASGGISQKNAMAMQIYADVLNMPVRIAASKQGPALGSAIFAAVAAGKKAGGYDDVFEAARDMGKVKDTVYMPIAENVSVYNKLYDEYHLLHDFFGRGGNDVMKRLKALRKEVTGV